MIALFSTAAEPGSIPFLETAGPRGFYIDVMTGAEVPVARRQAALVRKVVGTRSG